MCTWYLQQTKSSNCHLMVFNKLSPLSPEFNHLPYCTSVAFFCRWIFEKKTWPSRRICQTQKNTSQESLYLNETKYVNSVLNTFTNKCCNFGANQKCQMVASWDQKLSTNNSREQNTNQESTETNQPQPTDITPKITNVHEQHELHMNLKWTQVVRKSKQFLPIAIHLYVCPSASLVGL